MRSLCRRLISEHAELRSWHAAADERHDTPNDADSYGPRGVNRIHEFRVIWRLQLFGSYSNGNSGLFVPYGMKSAFFPGRADAACWKVKYMWETEGREDVQNYNIMLLH